MADDFADDAALDDAIPLEEPSVEQSRNLADLLVEVVQPRLNEDEYLHLGEAAVARLTRWYRLPGAETTVRFPILRTLAADGSPQALQAFAELLVAAPPTDDRQAVLTLVPLFQPRGDRLPDAAALFPRLLDALAHPPLAAAVLDLTNFLTRRGFVAEHPAKTRTGELATLLGSLAQRLAAVEERPQEYAVAPEELSKTVNDAVTLVVSLCDALALAGDPSVVGKLHQAMGLAHRRVQTEAAAALARLGDAQGIEHLKQLAVQPASRTRALAYLEELGALGQVDEQYRSAEARAAGEAAVWMAQPTRFGVAPDALELLDRRRQYWPGYVDPVECFLFAYEYQRGNRTAAGVVLSGPTHAAASFDMRHFPPDEIYAFYAGLDVEHDEIFDVPLDELTDEQATAWEQVCTALAEQGYADVELVRWGGFFAEQHAVATATRDGRRGVIVVADDAAQWIALPERPRGFGPDEVYAMYKGRKLLKSFNREDDEGDKVEE